MYHAFVLLATSQQIAMQSTIEENEKPLTNLCQTSPKILPVPLRMALNPIPTLETELSPNPSKCNAHVQVLSSFLLFTLCLENQRKGNKQVFFFFWGNSRALREMEEIDPRAFNSGADDSGLPIAHTYVNNGSNSKLYPSSKKARKSLSNLDAKVCLLLQLHFWIHILIKGSIIEFFAQVFIANT